MNASKADKIIKILEENTETTPKLNHKNPLELLVATILSAQSTDAQINKITPKLFKSFKTAQDFKDSDLHSQSAGTLDHRSRSHIRTQASQREAARKFANCELRVLEQAIHSSGFYHNKAKNIKAACTRIVEDFDGKVPDNMEDLTSLPGIGRKTANIILTYGFDKPVGIAVDTHVSRVSQRLGFTKNKDPNKIEQDLLELIPKKKWKKVNHLLVDHGRNVCQAKKPNCPGCSVRDLCPSAARFGYY